MVQLLLARMLLLSLSFTSRRRWFEVESGIRWIVVGGAKMVYDEDAVGETRAHIEARRAEHEATQRPLCQIAIL